MNPKESRTRVMIVSPNLLGGGPNGVADFITGITPHLRSEGAFVRLVAPAKKIFSLPESTDAHYTLGQTVALSHDGTRHQAAVTTNNKRAKNLLLHLRPDLVVFHQPLEGNLAHALMSAAPKREDGRRLPALIGHFHANAENLDPKTRIALEIGKYIRRPRLGRFGVPYGMTPGVIGTVMGELNGRIAVSNATARFWEGIYEQEQKYEVIYNGIDTEELTPEGPKIEAWDDGKKTILFAGRHDPRKGIEYLLEAYGLLRLGRNDIKLKITGEGQETEALKKMVQARGLQDVEFLGNLPRTELVKAYRTADVFVSPATGGEGSGRTNPEALACGTPVVGSDIDGFREIIGSDATGGRGFASTTIPKDPHDLASKIGIMLNLPELERERLSREAVSYVRSNFSWPSIARQTINYYNQVLIEHGRPNLEDWPQRNRKEKSSGVLARSGVLFRRFI